MTAEVIRELGMLVVSRDMTIREIANKTGFSKTNVHFNLMKLRDIDYDLFLAVRTRLEQHNKLKHIKVAKLQGENMLEIKVNKDGAVVNTDNTNYTDVVADMAIMVMSAADYMTEALKESNNVVTIDYGEFILDVAKVVAVYAELETKNENRHEERPS